MDSVAAKCHSNESKDFSVLVFFSKTHGLVETSALQFVHLLKLSKQIILIIMEFLFYTCKVAGFRLQWQKQRGITS